MKEMIAEFQKQLATVTEENHTLKEEKRIRYTTEFLTVHRLKIKWKKTNLFVTLLIQTLKNPLKPK